MRMAAIRPTNPRQPGRRRSSPQLVSPTFTALWPCSAKLHFGSRYAAALSRLLSNHESTLYRPSTTCLRRMHPEENQVRQDGPLFKLHQAVSDPGLDSR